jgi:hypothetical protein
MQEDYERNDFEPGEEEPSRAPIYSKWAIIGFAIISTFFGGVLLFLNLWRNGYRKNAIQVILFSLFYSFAAGLGVLYVGQQSVWFPILVDIGGALILSEYFYKRFFPDTELYEYKSIIKPLIIVVIIMLLLILFGPTANLPQ